MHPAHWEARDALMTGVWYGIALLQPIFHFVVDDAGGT